MTGILAGIKVVEPGLVLAGPFAGAILADPGAEAVKVEKPDGGDDARQMGPAFRHGAPRPGEQPAAMTSEVIDSAPRDG